MAVVSDYSYLGDANGWGRGSEFGTPFLIGDASSGRFTRKFTTGGVRRNAPALLTMMVRRLKDGTARAAIETPNTQGLDPAIAPDGEFLLGRISRQAPQSSRMNGPNRTLPSPSFILSGGQEANTLIIGRVQSGPSTAGEFDDFQVRDFYVFFKQDDD